MQRLISKIYIHDVRFRFVNSRIGAIIVLDIINTLRKSGCSCRINIPIRKIRIHARGFYLVENFRIQLIYQGDC